MLVGCAGPKDGPAGGVEKGWAVYGKSLPPPSGTRAFSDADLGLSVLLPLRLEMFDETPNARRALMRAVREVNPGLGDLRYQFGNGGANSISFVDMAPEVLAYGSLGGMSIGVVTMDEDLDLQELRQPEFGMSFIGEEKHPLGPVLHFSRRLQKTTVTKGNIEYQYHSYRFGRERFVWVVEFDYPSDLASSMAPMVHGILDSIRLSKPNPASLQKRLEQWRAEAQNERDREARAEDDLLRAEREAAARQLQEEERRSQRQGLEPPPGPDIDPPQNPQPNEGGG